MSWVKDVPCSGWRRVWGPHEDSTPAWGGGGAAGPPAKEGEGHRQQRPGRGWARSPHDGVLTPWCCSVAKLCLTLWFYGLQHARFLWLLLSLGVCSNSCPSSHWCYLTSSSFVSPFSHCPQSLPESRSFPMSWLFTSGGQSIGADPIPCWYFKTPLAEYDPKEPASETSQCRDVSSRKQCLLNTCYKPAVSTSSVTFWFSSPPGVKGLRREPRRGRGSSGVHISYGSTRWRQT